MHKAVIDAVREAHNKHWYMSGDASTGTKLANLVTQTWQDILIKQNPKRFEKEKPIADHLNERIDVVDTINHTAYELKVSPNNVHMEFYRDIFKAILAKKHTIQHLKRFVFLTPKVGSLKLKQKMGKAVEELGPSLGIEIEIYGF